MDSGYYEYLTTSAKNDPELNEHDKETVLAFLKRLDTNPDKYAVAPRTIAYLNEESLEYADRFGGASPVFKTGVSRHFFD